MRQNTGFCASGKTLNPNSKVYKIGEFKQMDMKNPNFKFYKISYLNPIFFDFLISQ